MLDRTVDKNCQNRFDSDHVKLLYYAAVPINSICSFVFGAVGHRCFLFVHSVAFSVFL